MFGSFDAFAKTCKASVFSKNCICSLFIHQVNHDEGEAEVLTPSSPTEAPSGGNICECLYPESDILMAFHFKI